VPRTISAGVARSGPSGAPAVVPEDADRVSQSARILGPSRLS